MTPGEVREAARDLYQRHADALGLKPWAPGGWREGPPTPKQRAAVVKVAGTALDGLTEADADVVRAVALRPDAAGKGACADVLNVALGVYGAQRAARGDPPPTPSPWKAAPAAPRWAPGSDTPTTARGAPEADATLAALVRLAAGASPEALAAAVAVLRAAP